MRDPARDNVLWIVLAELLDPMKGAQELASGIVQKYPEYNAMVEAVHSERNGDGLDSRQK